MLALLLITHLALLSYGVHRCTAYGQQLQGRLDRAEIGGKAAVWLAQQLDINGTRCMKLASDFQQDAEQYQGTILALLGGAGLSASMDGSRKP